jgi:RNA polymerase sigma-70 factor (ECF subfamily)
MQPTTGELVQAYLERGDEAAFRQLVLRHKDRIFGFLMGMVKNRTVANDLFQETFLRVISAMRSDDGSYVHDGRWLAWVMRIARNTTVDHLRRQKRRARVPDDIGDGHPFWETVPASTPCADEVLHRAEQRAVLDRHIQRLPPEQREVLLLRQETDLTFREIAELTGTPLNTALGRMRYALRNLRKMIEASGQESVVGSVDP